MSSSVGGGHQAQYISSSPQVLPRRATVIPHKIDRGYSVSTVNSPPRVSISPRLHDKITDFYAGSPSKMEKIQSPSLSLLGTTFGETRTVSELNSYRPHP